MRIEELLANAASLVDKVVEVEGCFAMVDEKAFIVASPDKRTERAEALKVAADGLKERMLARVPPLGGGKYYYLHDATIVGRLSTSLDSEFAFELTDITSLQVETSGESFCAIP